MVLYEVYTTVYVTPREGLEEMLKSVEHSLLLQNTYKSNKYSPKTMHLLKTHTTSTLFGIT